MRHIEPGDVAWMLVCTALVLLMTIPGLALFYAGMVLDFDEQAVVISAATTAAASG